MANADSLFREAVASIDAGDLATLKRLLAANPDLATTRLDPPPAWLRDQIGDACDGFFQRPYLLWFVAEDPVRTGKLPKNIAQIAKAIIEVGNGQGQEQLDYAIRLVAWSWIARECNVQIDLIDVLVDAGANPNVANDALVNGSFAAAEHLVERGAILTLAAALCLERWNDIDPNASSEEKQFALTLTALRGRANALRKLVEIGVDINSPCPDLYSHGTPLHHAVSSGSLESVKILIEAGANPAVKDKAWGATPLGWAEHAIQNGQASDAAKQYHEIAAFLKDKAGLTR